MNRHIPTGKTGLSCPKPWGPITCPQVTGQWHYHTEAITRLFCFIKSLRGSANFFYLSSPFKPTLKNNKEILSKNRNTMEPENIDVCTTLNPCTNFQSRKHINPRPEFQIFTTASFPSLTPRHCLLQDSSPAARSFWVVHAIFFLSKRQYSVLQKCYNNPPINCRHLRKHGENPALTSLERTDASLYIKRPQHSKADSNEGPDRSSWNGSFCNCTPPPPCWLLPDHCSEAGGVCSRCVPRGLLPEKGLGMPSHLGGVRAKHRTTFRAPLSQGVLSLTHLSKY